MNPKLHGFVFYVSISHIFQMSKLVCSRHDHQERSVPMPNDRKPSADERALSTIEKITEQAGEIAVLLLNDLINFLATRDAKRIEQINRKNKFFLDYQSELISKRTASRTNKFFLRLHIYCAINTYIKLISSRAQIIPRTLWGSALANNRIAKFSISI